MTTKQKYMCAGLGVLFALIAVAVAVVLVFYKDAIFGGGSGGGAEVEGCSLYVEDVCTECADDKILLPVSQECVAEADILAESGCATYELSGDDAVCLTCSDDKLLIEGDCLTDEELQEANEGCLTF